MSVVHANTVAAMSGHMLHIWGAKFQSSHNRKMAIPTLAAMAALTLLQNPHMQPEDVTVNYGDLNTYASRVQRYQRRRSRAASKISAVMRGYLSRANTFLGKLARYEQGSRGWEGGTRGNRIGPPIFTMWGHQYRTPHVNFRGMVRQRNIAIARRDYRYGGDT